MCDGNFLTNHTFKYAKNNLCNVVQNNSNVVDFKNAPAIRSKACKIPANDKEKNNKVYRCQVLSYNKQKDVMGQLQNSSVKMRRSKLLNTTRGVGRTTVYY